MTPGEYEAIVRESWYRTKYCANVAVALPVIAEYVVAVNESPTTEVLVHVEIDVVVEDPTSSWGIATARPITWAAVGNGVPFAVRVCGVAEFAAIVVFTVPIVAPVGTNITYGVVATTGVPAKVRTTEVTLLAEL